METKRICRFSISGIMRISRHSGLPEDRTIYPGGLSTAALVAGQRSMGGTRKSLMSGTVIFLRTIYPTGPHRGWVDFFGRSKKARSQ